MKTKLMLVLTVISMYAQAQTAEKKNNLSAGIGKGSYNGDLGNAWFDLKDEWYGLAGIYYSRYLNKSFDLSLTATTGDYGHCREEDDPEIRPDGTVVLNMLGRLTTGIVSVKYKLANGYLLKEKCIVAPYLYVGGGINNITEKWWPDHARANQGTYASLNGGLGLRFNLSDRFNITYNSAVGYFMADDIDYRSEGRNDLYMQTSLAFGINF